VFGGREGGHVAAGLGDDHLGRVAPDAGDRAQQLNRRCERAELLFDRGRELVDCLVEVVDVRDPPDDHDVLGVETALQRFPQRGDLLRNRPRARSASTTGSVVPDTSASEHRAPGLAHHVANDAVELDPGVLHHLVQPVHLALEIADLALAIPGQVAQRPHRLRWHQARPQQPGLQQLAKPLPMW
jgi:hypothetical protein